MTLCNVEPGSDIKTTGTEGDGEDRAGGRAGQGGRAEFRDENHPVFILNYSQYTGRASRL